MLIIEETGPPRAPSLLTINLDAVAANYQILAARAAPAECAAVVKADAYGLGVAPIARALLQQGCKTFFVAQLDEGVALRRIAPNADIYILNGFAPDDEAVYLEFSLRPVLNDLGQIEQWRRRRPNAPKTPLAAAIQLDTGMSRLGLSRSEQATLFANPERLEGVELSLVMSHLACADEPGNAMNTEQLLDFETARQHFPGIPASLAASSGIFLGSKWRFDMVRPGACLYGVKPNDLAPNPMAQVVMLQGKILQIQDVDTPRSVGYGATYRVGKSMRIATIAAGYADGFSRMLSNNGVAYIGDTPLPVVGRVSMDLITVDLSGIPDGALSPRIGDMVDLIGPHNDLDNVASAAGAIGYEVLTSLGRRYRRRYIGAASLSTPAEAE